MLQNATHLRKSAPWPPNISDEHVFCTAPATQNASFKILFKGPTPAIVFRNATKPSRFAHFWQGAQSFAPATRKHIWAILNVQKCSEPIIFLHFWLRHVLRSFAPQRRALFRHLIFQKWSGPGVLCTFWLRNVLRATTACTFSTSPLPKVVRTWCALYILTSKCASHHNACTFSTSQLPKVVRTWCVLYTFWLRNVLHATTACTFSRSQLPKVVRSWCVLYILTSKCASRHNGVQFFISHLARWLRTRRFSEPTFRPSGATNHSTNTVFRDFPTFSRTCIFFLLALSLLWSSLFYSSLLSDSSHLCFSSVHIVGSLTSNIPSNNNNSNANNNYIYVYIVNISIFLTIPLQTPQAGRHFSTQPWYPAIPKVPGVQQDGFAASSLGSSGSPRQIVRSKMVPWYTNGVETTSNHKICVYSL